LNAKSLSHLFLGILLLFLLLISIGSGRTQAAPTSVRINAGATTSYTDNSGNAWLADQFVTGGTTYANTNTIAGITPAPQVYRTERYGQGKSSFA
jgi:hypothetical protein